MDTADTSPTSPDEPSPGSEGKKDASSDGGAVAVEGEGPATAERAASASPEPAETAPARPPRERRRAPMALVTWLFVVLVLLIVVVLLVLKVTQGSTTAPSPPVVPASGAVVSAVTSIPETAFAAAGAPPSSGPLPTLLKDQPGLTIGGRPAVVYVGAEFSPYSAAVRWALVAALGRFGTFSNLGATSSSKFEVFSLTPTFSFDGSSYHSRYVAFSATEQYGQNPSMRAPAGFPALNALTPLQTMLLGRYGTSSGGTGSPLLPFVDIANHLVLSGSQIGYSPGLMAGSSMGNVAGDVTDPSTPVGSAVLGEANVLSAGICMATGQSPGSVCNSGGVRAADAALGYG